MSHLHHNHNNENKTLKALGWAFGLNLFLFVVEAVCGYVFNSLALMADASHMFTDVLALGIALLAAKLANKPPTSNKTYGYSSVEVLGGLTNSVIMIVFCFLIFKEAVERALTPPEVSSLPVLVVGIIGLLVNLGSAYYLARGDRSNLNVRGALLHMVADAIGSVGAIIAAVFIHYGIMVADAVVSGMIGFIVLFSSYNLLKDCVEVLLNFSPKSIDTKEVEQAILNLKGVKEIHDLHIWSLNGSYPLLTVHVLTSMENTDALLDMIAVKLKEFNIEHSTVQVEKKKTCKQINCC